MWQYNRFKKKTSSTKTSETPKAKKSNDVERLDRVFSKYIRLRDAMENGYTKCISCGKIKPFDKFDAGHYYSRSHMATRYDEDNVHSECILCNRMTGGEHMIGYRENLIRKIGMPRFTMLEFKAHQMLKKSDIPFEQLIKAYREKAKALAKEKNIVTRI